MIKSPQWLRTKHPGTVMRTLRLLQLLNRLLHLGKMNVGVLVISHMGDFAILADQKADSPSTVVRSRAGPVGIGDFTIRVRKQREVKSVFRDKRFVAFSGVKTNPDHL